jgi:hypothetical protein
MRTSRNEVELLNPRSDQHVTLGTDQVREYMTDARRSDGVLKLKSQIFLFARGATVEQLEPLGSRLRTGQSITSFKRSKLREAAFVHSHQSF